MEVYVFESTSPSPSECYYFLLKFYENKFVIFYLYVLILYSHFMYRMDLYPLIIDTNY